MDFHQKLMNEAYDVFGDHPELTHEEFFNGLDNIHKIAVVTGNFNYQVCNGGFMQWHRNQYSKQFDFLSNVLDEMDTASSLRALRLAEKALVALKRHDNYSGDNEDAAWDRARDAVGPLDSKFYEIDGQLLADVESFLRTLGDYNDE